MLWLRVYGWPMLFTLLIHLGVGWLLLVGWQGEPTFSQPVSKPSLIKATVVELPKPKTAVVKKKKPTAKVKKPKAKPKSTPKATSPKVKSPPAKSIAKSDAKSKTPPKKEPTIKPLAVPTAQPDTALDLDLSEELAAEDALREAETEQELVNSYIAKIMAMVESVWSRPPSARNGMQAILVVNLIPTGEVVNVSVAESSGNAAFDTSAVNAVYKVERFDDLRGMKPAMFEASFRRFRLIFKPEDLRL